MNDFGKLFKVNIFGTSHGESFGILIDGIPAGISVLKEDFINDLERRKPKNAYETTRTETDEPIIESGVFNGYTNGTPLMIRFENKNQDSCSYENLKDIPRPGHADFVANKKFNGFNDYRGGGAFSGRLTAALVAAGVIAKKVTGFDYKEEILLVGDLDDNSKKEEYLESIKAEGDSVGGVIRITVKDVPIGLGEPYFYSAESAISQILYSVGGVKGVSFGDGFAGISLKGSEFNDSIIDREGHTSSNHNGGINGGITNGNDLIVNVFVKPIASISKEQQTYNMKYDKMDSLVIEGKHDASIIDRIPVVLESAIAIALADLYLLDKAYK